MEFVVSKVDSVHASKTQVLAAIAHTQNAVYGKKRCSKAVVIFGFKHQICVLDPSVFETHPV